MKILKNNLVKYIPTINKHLSAGASLKYISEKLHKSDKLLSTFNVSTLYNSLHRLMKDYENDLTFNEFRNIVVIKIPTDEINTFSENNFLKFSNLHLGLKSNLSYFEKFILKRNEFLSSKSQTIVDSLYVKRFMRWFDIEDEFLINKSKLEVIDFEKSKNLYNEELDNIDQAYVKIYSVFFQKLLSKL